MLPILTKTKVIAFACCFAFVSCVNDDYDLTKDVDTKINIDGDVSAPLGDSELILIGDFMNLDQDDADVLKTDLNGDYYVSIEGSGSATNINVPSFTIDEALVSGGGFDAKIRRSDIISQVAPGSGSLPLDRIPIPSGVKYTEQFRASDTPLEVNQSVPVEIVDIKDASASAVATVSLQMNVGKAVLTGLSLDFPDYLEISSVSGTGCTLDKNTNTLSFQKVTISTGMTVVKLNISGLDFNKMPAGQGFDAKKHRIILNDAVKLSAFSAELSLSDFGSTMADLPETAEMNIGINVPSVNVKDVTVKVQPDIILSDQIVNVGTLPDFMNGSGVVLDLYNPMITINVDNRSPLALNLNADIKSMKSGSLDKVVHIGNSGTKPTDAVEIAASGKTSVFLSRTGENAPVGALNVKVSNISDVMEIVPEKIGITGIDVEAADEFITISSGAYYQFFYDYAVKAPLAFGDKLSVTYNTDFSGWNETFNPKDTEIDINVKQADLTFDFMNMIPLGMVVKASAIDLSGNILNGVDIHFEGDASVPAGSLDKPQSKAMHLVMKASADDLRRIDGIRLKLDASASDSNYQGICLNKNQGVRFSNMKIRLRAAVDVEL